jgi:hypothetical protein
MVEDLARDRAKKLYISIVWLVYGFMINFQ